MNISVILLRERVQYNLSGAGFHTYSYLLQTFIMNPSKLSYFTKVITVVLFSLIFVLGSAQGPTKLRQAVNGSLSSIDDPVEWVTGNANHTKAHYAECMTVPYQLEIIGLSTGVNYCITIGWDIKHNGKHALDFLTSYDREGSHNGFGHDHEEIDPTDLTLLESENPSVSVFTIPAPSSVGSPVANEPTTTFNAMSAAEKYMTIYNGTISDIKYGVQGDLTASNSASFLEICFSLDDPNIPSMGDGVVVFAWGAHIASQDVWGSDNSAVAITGSPYHMFFADCNSCTNITCSSPGSLFGCGQKDVQLAASAVEDPPECSVTGPSSICSGEMVTYTATTDNTSNTYFWEIVNNGTMASIISGASSSEVQIDAGNGPGSFEVQVTIFKALTGGTLQSTCSQLVAVSPTVVATCTGDDLDCFGDTDGQVSVSGSGGTIATDYSYQWDAAANSATTATVSGLGQGTYSVTITDDNGCSDVCSATITQPAAAVVATCTGDDLDCFGDTDGQVSVSGSGGTVATDYSYQWDAAANSATTATVSGLGQGTYSVTITDDNGCSDVCSATVTQPAAAVVATCTGDDLDCFGDTDGQVSVSGSGGTIATDYSYQWDAAANSATTATVSGLGQGTYSVTITDDNGCSDVCSATITQPAAAVVATCTGDDLDCFGDTDGQVSVRGSGGTIATDYSYQWDAAANSATTATVSGLGQGTYSVTITDDNGCSDVCSATITQPAAAVVATCTGDDLDCFGDTDGQVSVSGSGGTIATDYSYQWDAAANSATTATVSGLGQGTYSVTITDDNGCSDVCSATITQPAAAVVATCTGDDLDCFGDTDGQVSVSGSGGTIATDYSYQWDAAANSATTATVSGLGQGTYSVTITDDNGCSDVCSATITQPAAAVVATCTGDDLDCFGDVNGVVSVSGSGGTVAGDYSYQWDAAAGNVNTATVSGLGAGSYSVTITDDNGCTDNCTATITQPTVVVATCTGDALDCNGDVNGVVSVSGSGGTVAGDYSYQWDAAAGNANTATVSGLGAGSYSVTITDDNGCTDNCTATITQPTVVVATCTGDALDCNGDVNGVVSVSGSGGTVAGDYSYQWDAAAGNANTATVSGLGAGSYSVTITDDNGCTDDCTATITQPTVVVATCTGDALDCNGDVNGVVSVSGSGGTVAGDYSYQWDAAAGNANTATVSGLGAGSYSVTITDDNGCTDDCTATITQPTVVVATCTGDALDCNGDVNGVVSVSGSGGTVAGDYSYQWDAAAGNANTATVSGLGAGSYSVTITDDNGCTDDCTATITQPTVVVATCTGDALDCNGDVNGVVSVSGSGGTVAGDYSYQWDAAAGNANTATVSGLGAGSYSVTITDDNGCTDDCTATITQPTVVVATCTGDALDCNGDVNGVVSVSGSGGTVAGDYSYQWDAAAGNANTATVSGLGAGSYSVTITDDNGCTDDCTATITQPTVVVATCTGDALDCNGDVNGVVSVSGSGGTVAGDYSYQWDAAAGNANTATVSGLGAGSYSVTITDDNGCTDDCTAPITQPTVVVATCTGDALDCNGDVNGVVSVSGSGGTVAGDYNYQWDAAAGNANTATVSGLGAGSYSVTITDDNGCTDNCTATITQPTVVVATCTGDALDCNGDVNGVVSVSGSGGTIAGDYSYQWDAAAGNANTATVSGSGAGSYSVTITDDNGCTDDCTATITQPTVVVATCTGDALDCNGDVNGVVSVSGSGGTVAGDYSYQWDAAAGNANTATVSGLGAGSYRVTITDDNGCADDCTATITQPTVVVATCTGDALDCNGDVNGVVSVSGSGGTVAGDYSYQWDAAAGNANTATVSGLGAGSYSVTITDDNGCSDVCSATITQPPPLTCVDSVVVNADCNAASTGSATINVSGGTPGIDLPYTYLWSNGQKNQTAVDLTAGDYLVTVTDDAGCTIVCDATVSEASELSADILAFCVDGEALINLIGAASGGTTPYTYTWQGPDGFTSAEPSLSNVAQGTYTLVVTDANGCTFTTSETKDDCCDMGTLLLAAPAAQASCHNGASPPTAADVPPPIALAVLMNDLQVTGNCVSMAELLVESDVTGPVVDGALYTFTRTYYVSAPNALPAQANEMITILYDPLPPVLSGLPEDLVLTCGSELPEVSPVTGYDNVSFDVPVQVSESNAGLNCSGYLVERTYTASDGCNNTVTGTQLITFIDDEAPTLVVPGDTTIYCPGEIPPADYISATDNCSAFDLSFDEKTTELDNCDYILTRTWTAKDACGNETIATQSITFHDRTGPSIVVTNPMLAGLSLGDEMITYGCDDPRVVMEDVTITDDCCGIAESAAEDKLIASHTCDVFGYFRKWKCLWWATDEAGNYSEFYFYVVQYDTTAPVIYNVPSYLEVSCDSVIPMPDTTVYAEDDCALTSHLMFEEDTVYDASNPSSFALIRTWSAEDFCHNKSEAVQVIAVCGFDTLLISSSIGNQVWEDVNANGLQDSLESGINDVTVYLYNQDILHQDGWYLVDSTTTASKDGLSGLFHFKYLHPGEYRVRFKQMEMLSFTSVNEGTDEALDSDADPETGMTDPIYILTNEDADYVDAGMRLGVIKPINVNEEKTKMQPCESGDCMDDDLQLNVFPNPFSDEISLEYTVESNTDMHLEVFDALGRSLKTIRSSAVTGRNQEKILLNKLDSGVYYVRLKAGARSGYKMIIKAR